jgi:hypothetical protein
MIETTKRLAKLGRLFHRKLVLTMEALVAWSRGRSRRSLFRDLANLGYLSSYTHAGCYYTLADMPEFDADGLWFHQGVGFSRSGTLKATVVELVHAAEAGLTHDELRVRLRVRVQNTLLDLARSKQIRRELFADLYLYLSAEQDGAAKQLARRKQQTPAEPPRGLPMTTIIEILLDVIRCAQVRVDAREVASRLAARGIIAGQQDVQQTLERYGIEKKTGRRPLKRSKR